MDHTKTWEGLIPNPVYLEKTEGAFEFSEYTKIKVAEEDVGVLKIAQYLADLLKPATGYPFEISQDPSISKEGNISLKLKDDSTLGDEGYELLISSESINISANKAHGLFNGVQTLRQLLPSDIESKTKQDRPWIINSLMIQDYPRFRWRGAMIDVARSFFTVDEIKRYIDLFAVYKINKLHLHLSDDQGWRIEIKSWPNLTNHGGDCAAEGGRSGFYTQKDYKEIVTYAHERFMTVVPEIDVPGHTNAALSSYAELNNNGVAPDHFKGMEVGFSTLVVDKELTYEFLTDVFTELAAITPGPYLHVGGDEALSTTEAEYSLFLSQLQPIIASLNKTMVGWGEVAHWENLDSATIVQLWQRAEKQDHEAALKRGVKCIISPSEKIYVDMKYNKDTHVGQDWSGYIEVDTSYNWDPVTVYQGISEEDVLGIEIPIWTETIHNPDDADYMLFPRLTAGAEISWAPPDNKSWEEYRLRLAKHGERLSKLGINFYRSPLIPWK